MAYYISNRHVRDPGQQRGLTSNSLEKEMRQVRAKFRCLSVSKKWDSSISVEFGPVLQQGNNPENSEFWKYTPSGDAQLNFRGPALDDRGEEYEPGAYYYIDMTKDDEGGWCLSQVAHRGEDSGDVDLCTRGGKHTADYNENGFTYGKLHMGLDHAPALGWFDNPGGPWSVKFSWAEASDG